MAFEKIQRAGSLPRSPQPDVGHGQHLGCHALDDRDELNELGFQLVAKEAIDLERMAGVRGVDRAEDVDVHPCRLSSLPAAHDVVERALAALVDAIGVVHLARPVDAQADEELVRLEECAPRVVQVRAVGLDGVGDLLVRRCCARSTYCIERSKNSRPISVGSPPCQPTDHFRARLRLEQLADVGFEQVVGHPEPAPG